MTNKILKVITEAAALIITAAFYVFIGLFKFICNALLIFAIIFTFFLLLMVLAG